MNKNITTMIVDIGILLVLVAIAFGIWFCPWITVFLLAIVVLGGCFFGHDSG